MGGDDYHQSPVTSWYTDLSTQRKELLAWILRQPRPGAYGAALMRLQSGALPAGGVDLQRMLDELEGQVINDAMLVSNGVASHAAPLVGLKRTTFNHRRRLLAKREARRARMA